MTKLNKLKILLTVMNNLDGCDNLPDFDDIHYMKSTKIGNIQFKLYVLTMKVIDDQITDEELKVEINKLVDEINETLTDDEKDYLKKDYRKTMNLGKEVYD